VTLALGLTEASLSREARDCATAQLGFEEAARVLTDGGPELFDDVVLETLDKRDHLALFSVRHLVLRHGRRGMAEEHASVALADAHTSMA